MSFVTKKEVEDAVKLLEKAASNGQITYAPNGMVLDRVLFAGTDEDGVKFERVSFLSPLQAAKSKQFAINHEIKKQREMTEKNQKTLEKLELESQSLRAIISTLKE